MKITDYRLEKLGITCGSVYKHITKNYEWDFKYFETPRHFWDYTIWPLYSEMLENLLNVVAAFYEAGGFPKSIKIIMPIVEKASGKTWNAIIKILNEEK